MRPAPSSTSDFIDTYCDGFDDAAQAWRKLDFADLLPLAGLSRAAIEAFVDDVVAARSVTVCWAMGLTQHHNAVATIREIVNFLLLRGNIGRPGAGACPVRGHSNVQGDRTMGIWERPTAAFLDALRNEFRFEPPREHGYDTVDTIRAMRDGKIDVFFALGGNFVAATPDTDITMASMQRCALTVQVSTKLNRSHLHTGREALILPCLGRTEHDHRAGGEQFVTVEDSMSMVHASRGRLVAGLAPIAQRGRDRHRPRRSDCSATTSAGAPWATTTASSAGTSSTSSPASTPSRSGSPRPAGSCCPTGRATRVRSQQPPARPASRSTS